MKASSSNCLIPLLPAQRSDYTGYNTSIRILVHIIVLHFACPCLNPKIYLAGASQEMAAHCLSLLLYHGKFFNRVIDLIMLSGLYRITRSK